MTTSRRLTWTAVGSAGLAGLVAGVHSVADGVVTFVPGGTDVISYSASMALSSFTGWVVAVALVTTAASNLVSVRGRSWWWGPSTVGSTLLVLWTASAWADGLRVASDWRAGGAADQLVSWPGDSTPLGWWDDGVAPGWDLDLLSASGPAILLLTMWAGPLALRFGVGRSHPAAPCTDVSARPAPEGVLRREIARATSVASAVGVALCAAAVYLQLAGGIFAASSPYGEPVVSTLLRPAGLVVVLAMVTAWVAARPGPGTAPVSPPAPGVVLVLVGAVAAVAVLEGYSTDLVVLVVGTLGVLCAAAHAVLGDKAATLLMASGSAPEPRRRTSTATPPLVSSNLGTGAEHPSSETARPPAVDALP